MTSRPALIWSSLPEVRFATNTFRRVPIILQYDDVALIQLVKTEQGGVTTEFDVYDDSGTRLAVVKGARVFPTEAGESAGLDVGHAPKRSILHRGGQELIAIDHVRPASIALTVEIYAPNGTLIKAAPEVSPLLFQGNEPLRVGGTILSNNIFEGGHVAIRISSSGSIGVGD